MKKQENMRLEELTTHKKNKRLLKREKFMKKCIDELNQELTDHPTSYKLNSCHAKLENNSKHIKRQFAVTHSLLALATLTTIVGVIFLVPISSFALSALCGIGAGFALYAPLAGLQYALKSRAGLKNAIKKKELEKRIAVENVPQKDMEKPYTNNKEKNNYFAANVNKTPENNIENNNTEISERE